MIPAKVGAAGTAAAAAVSPGSERVPVVEYADTHEQVSIGWEKCAEYTWKEL
jgi:hypothetical protein